MAKLGRYVCDICGIQRADANHWFVAFVQPKAHEVSFYPWHELEDSFEERHLCGQVCAHKLLDQFLSGEMK